VATGFSNISQTQIAVSGDGSQVRGVLPPAMPSEKARVTFAASSQPIADAEANST
jgi:hypothetical protein